jgi:hypothetical protein
MRAWVVAFSAVAAASQMQVAWRFWLMSITMGRLGIALALV